jgi:hypothetical protein
MQPGLLPLAVLLALGLVAGAVWAALGAVRVQREARRLSLRHGVVLMACCTAIWSASCLFFMLLASLGHSAHPLRDSWPQCLAGFVVVVAAPSALLVRLAARRPG